MDEKTRLYSAQNFLDFREWINLNTHAVTWQGRYKDEFEDFWTIFFTENLSLFSLIERFEYLKLISKVGPLSSWFNWLEEKFLCFVFIHDDYSIKDIADETQLPVAYVANTLRTFFLDVFPHLDDYLNEHFQVSNVSHPNIYFNYTQIEKDMNVRKNFPGCHDDEVLNHMEVTLYDEWSLILKKLRSEFSVKKFSIKKIQPHRFFMRQAFLLLEAIVLFLIGIGIIWGIKEANHWYEKKLTDDVKIFEPQYQWLNTKLRFKKESNVYANIKASEEVKRDLENIDDKLSNKLGASQEEERYEVESEVVLTSWGALPKDFDKVGYEHSSYEEKARRGYRESRYGGTKVYRVMIRSIDTNKTREKLNNLLDAYNVVKVDNVEPGLAVPGGNYYNLYVPRNNLKEFMANVMEVDEAVLYESRTRTSRNPPNKNKVFIWVKLI